MKIARVFLYKERGMRNILVATVAAVVGAALWAGPVQAGKVEVKGVHLCCMSCVKGVAAALKNVNGVSGAKCDREAKTVTFNAKDEKAAVAGIKALNDAGYFGSATEDGKAVKVETASPKKGDKADVVTVKKVHVCCKRCQNTIAGQFKDAKITYSGKGTMKTVKISAKGLDKAEVLEKLRKAGFNGSID